MVKNTLTFKQKYLQDSVYGASDGIVTTFAVVAGVTGASLSPLIILILGFANLVADGFSMGVGSYLSRKSEKEFFDAKKKQELKEIAENPVAQKKDLEKLLIAKGYKGETLKKAIKAITANKKLWGDLILMEDLNLADENKKPIKNAIATFVAFFIAGLMPLLAYVIAEFVPSFQNITFEIAVIITAATLIAVGMIKSSVTERIWWKESGQMLILGGAAAFLAYLVGYFISIIV